MDKLEIKRALLYNKPSILDSQSCCTQGEHTNLYTTDALYGIWYLDGGSSQFFSGPNWFLPDLAVGPACLGISGYFWHTSLSVFSLAIC
jgi:hypothetical protein